MITDIIISPASCESNENLIGVAYMVLYDKILVGNVLIFKHAEEYSFQYPRVDYGTKDKVDRFSFIPTGIESRKEIEDAIIEAYKKHSANQKPEDSIQ